MRRQVRITKKQGLSAGDVLAAVATTGIAFNVGSRRGNFNTVNLTFSHCEPRLRRNDLMHLRLTMSIPRTQSVEEVFNIVNHYIGGRWKRENPKGSFDGDKDNDAAAFGRCQVLDDFLPARYAYTYLNMIQRALPAFKSDVWSAQFALRQELADHSTPVGSTEHSANRMAKNWVSCLRGAGLSEHQIGQWITLLNETSRRFDPADPKSSLKRCIQGAARLLMSADGEEESQAAWNAKRWELTAVQGIRDCAFVYHARSIAEMINRLSIFEEAQIEEPPYDESLLKVALDDLVNGFVPFTPWSHFAASFIRRKKDTLL